MNGSPAPKIKEGHTLQCDGVTQRGDVGANDGKTWIVDQLAAQSDSWLEFLCGVFHEPTVFKTVWSIVPCIFALQASLLRKLLCDQIAQLLVFAVVGRLLLLLTPTFLLLYLQWNSASHCTKPHSSPQ